MDAEQVVAVLQFSAFRVKLQPPMLPPWATMTPSAPDFGHHDLSGYRVGLVLYIDDRVLGQASHAAKQNLRIAFDQHRPAGQIRVDSFGDIVIQRQYVVASRLDQPQALQFVKLFRHLLRQIVCLAPVFIGVVEFPIVVVECRRLSPTSSQGVLCCVTAVQPLW